MTTPSLLETGGGYPESLAIWILKLSVISASVKCIVTIHDMFCWFPHKKRAAAMTIFYFSTLPFLTVGNLIKGDRALNSLSRNSPATKIKFSSPSLSLSLSQSPSLDPDWDWGPPQPGVSWLWRPNYFSNWFFPRKLFVLISNLPEEREGREVGVQQMMMSFYSIHLALL